MNKKTYRKQIKIKKHNYKTEIKMKKAFLKLIKINNKIFKKHFQKLIVF